MNAGSSLQRPSEPGRGVPAAYGSSGQLAHDRIDISETVSFFRRRHILILAVAAIVFAIGAMITVLSDKVYTATAVVALEPPTGAQDGNIAFTAGPTPSDSFIETQSEIIASREMARKVAENLGLLDGQPPGEQREIIDNLQSNVMAERTGESFALTLYYEADNGEDAARKANEYARRFVNWETQNTGERDSASLAAIEERLGELQQQAQADTAALQGYRIQNDLLSTTGSTLTEQEIANYNQEVASARAQAAEDTARLNTALAQLRSGSSGDDVGEALASPVISSLRNQETALASQVASLSSRYGENYPELIRSRSELTEVRQSIQDEIGRVVSNLRAKKAVSQQRLGSLQGSLGSARSRLSQNNAAMVGLDGLQRRADVSQGLYEAYLANYQQLAAAEGIQRPNARILSLAEVPRLPTSPNVVMNLGLAAVIGLGLGLVFAFIAETFFRGVTSAQELSRETGLRYLGAIPLLSSTQKDEKNRLQALANDPRSAFAESFRSLMISIEQASLGPSKVIALTSALPKEGKTTTSVCLAQMLAYSGSRTIIVDCDYVRRGLSRLLNVQRGRADLFSVLTDECPLQDALVKGQSLSILPIIGANEQAETLLSGEQFSHLLDRLRTEFDHVILDLPPVLPTAATRMIVGRADATVMLIRWRKTSISALQTAIAQMPEDRINLVGVALTQVDLRRRGLFSQSDPYFHYKEYKEYYS